MHRHSSPSLPRSSSPILRPAHLLSFALLILGLAAAAGAQPFGSWGLYSRSTPGSYFQIPHSPALNPTGQITIEGWVDVQDPGSCSNIVGKGYTQAWWVGVCGDNLRSYLQGSSRTAGAITGPGWHHFAVTYDGAQRCHYIDGKPPTCWVQTGPLTTSSSSVRIGSDVSYSNFSPNGAINEIRLWSVARTQDQIRSTINVPITSSMPGLVAVWANGGPTDVVGSHNGVEVGTVPRLTFPVFAGGCTSTDTTLCVLDRFLINVDYESLFGDGPATRTNPSSFRSGLFWFFDPTNWEVMVKVLDGCPINMRYWVYSAATTDVFFRMEVFDQEAGRNKVYFNYAGSPAPAITDSAAFATCP